MKILRFEVDNLLERTAALRIDLQPDLNILTGRNGAGKTSTLKLLWYVMSGNILLALTEVPFSRVYIQTDLYECTIFRISRITCKVEMVINGEKFVFEDLKDDDDDGIPFENAEDMADPLLMQRGSSVFFPTFRRIEGGFTLSNVSSASVNRNRISPNTIRKKSDVEDALIALARKLTNAKHAFVTAISTADIVGLLLSRFADLSTEYNEIQQKTSDEIIGTIKRYESGNDLNRKVGEADQILDQIRLKIEGMEERRESIMAPIEAVRAQVERLFKNTGIKFGNRLSFGDAAKAVNSDALSAGEKQMLSFICYNAFNADSIILIDEPELSLHVDWQRQLFPILMAQQSSNQFIIATHSPFIYSKYPEKEVQVDLDRGDAET